MHVPKIKYNCTFILLRVLLFYTYSFGASPIGHQKMAQVNFATYKTVFKQYQRLPTSVDALKTNYCC